MKLAYIQGTQMLLTVIFSMSYLHQFELVSFAYRKFQFGFHFDYFYFSDFFSIFYMAVFCVSF